MLVEVSPGPTELALLERRFRRLEAMEAAVRTATRNLRTIGEAGNVGAVRIRKEFVFQASPAPGDASDRRIPPPQHRPPSTRLISPRGSALRLMLIALFEAQARITRPKAKPGNDRPLDGDASTVGWIDLLVTDAKPSRAGKTYMSTNAKKSRSLKNALDTLESEELVILPYRDDRRNKYRGFLLAMECGRRDAGSNDLYSIPLDADRVFNVPAELFTQGWIYALEDRELAYLLMLAYFHHPELNGVRVDSETRLLHMGIGRETMAVHPLFQELGLVQVTPYVDRRWDGTVENFSEMDMPLPDLLRFIPEGLAGDGFQLVMKAIDRRMTVG